MIHYHERCRNVDQEAIDTLTVDIDNREDMASDKDLITAASFLWHCQQFKRAGQYCQKIIDNTGGSQSSVCLKGWIFLSAPKEELQLKSLQFFEQAIEEDATGHAKHIESMLGKAKVFEKTKKYDLALETLSEIAIQNKDFFPALLEKTKIHMVNGDWEQALETVQKVLVKDKQNVEGLRIYAFYLLTRENDIEYVLEKLDELVEAMKHNEPNNAELFYNMSRLFARYCGRREAILQKTLRMLDEAVALQPENADFHSEIAHQKCMLGEYSEGYQIYQRASTFDETNQGPLHGMIYCKIQQDSLEDAGQQLDFLMEMSESHQKTAEHAYLEAIICWRHKRNKEQAIKLLDQALNLHITQTKTHQSNIDFYIKLSADFLLQLAQQYLLHCGSKPISANASVPKHLMKATKLLENVTKQNQGLTEAQVLLAKSRWLANDQNAALKELHDCLEKDSTMVEAHILAALINSECGNSKASNQNLQQAFAQDFSIRENPVFMLMRSEVEMKAADWEGALKTLEAAYNLPQVQDPSYQPPSMAGQKKYSLPYGQEERARIFMNLIKVQCEVKEFDKAKKIMARAIAEFQGTPEEVKVMLTQSDMALKMGDVKKALAMLKKITPDNVSFVEAKKKQAQLYLDELKDRMNYQRCYLEILDNDPSVDNFKLTAQALMDIQEPEEAIQYYEKALEKDTDNMVLIREVGKALVMTHDYNRAIKYYEQTLHDDPKLFDLRIDLAELYIKLKAFDDCKRVLIEALKSIKEFKQDIDSKTRNVNTLVLLSKVYLEEDMQGTDWKFKANPDAKQALIEASRS